VAIAQVISRAGQFEGIGAGDVQQLLGAGTDANDAAVFGLQAFAVKQRRLATLQKQPDVFTLGTETAQDGFCSALRRSGATRRPRRVEGRFCDESPASENFQLWTIFRLEQGACQSDEM
jgi:hypothetical protein